MCNRFTVRTPASEVAKFFNTPGLIEFQLALRFNVAPTQNILTIRNGEQGREPAIMRWGLIPSWSKEFKTEFETFNAKSETAFEKPAFRSAMKKRRCLIPADGYIEWKTENKKKQPYFVTLRKGGINVQRTEGLFAFAGLWESWNKHLSCTIMTTAPNEELKSLHHRMPVILSPNDYDVWLNAENTDVKYLYEPFPASELKVTRIDPIINSVLKDNPAVLKEFGEEQNLLPGFDVAT